MSVIGSLSAGYNAATLIATAQMDLRSGPQPDSMTGKPGVEPGNDHPFQGTTFMPRTENADPSDPVKTVYLQDPSGAPDIAPVLNELKSIGQRRGFNVDISSGATLDAWARDSAILFKDRQGRPALLVSSVPAKVFEKAYDKLEQLAGLGGQLGNVRSLGRAFFDGLSSRVGDGAEKKGWTVRRTPIAIDGGNLLVTRNAKGETTALVGRNSLLLNWFAMKDCGQINAKTVATMVANKQFDPAVAAQMKVIYQASGKPISESQANTAAAELAIVKNKVAKALNLSKRPATAS